MDGCPNKGPTEGGCAGQFSMMGHTAREEGGERDSLAPLVGAIEWTEPVGKWSRVLGGRAVPHHITGTAQPGARLCPAQGADR